MSGGKDEGDVEHLVTQLGWRETYLGGRNSEAARTRMTRLVEEGTV